MKTPQTAGVHLSRDTHLMVGGGGSGRALAAVQLQLFIFSSALFEEKLPVLTSCVYHLRYCKLLCMDLNCNHTCFSCMKHWWIKWAEKAIHYVLLQVVLLYLGSYKKVKLKKKKLHSVLCLVGVNWFFTEMFRQDHTAKAGMKTLSLWYVLGVLWTYCYIANISK